MTDFDELSAELADFAPDDERPSTNHTEARVIAGFEEIMRFVETHGRRPTRFDDADVFEHLYAIRLARLRTLTEYHELLRPIDTLGLLDGNDTSPLYALSDSDEIDLDALSAELDAFNIADDITTLRHVRSAEEIRTAEEIAKREPCEDFTQFKGLFQRIKEELARGARRSIPISEGIGVELGQFFILQGQLAYIAEMGEEFFSESAQKPDARMRVIYDNGTQSNLLRRSFQRAFYREDSARRISEPDDGPLFRDAFAPDEVASGHIYVLRSLSEHPTIAANRKHIHKIGVTRGDVARRIADAPNQPTYLLAAVEEVARYSLAGIDEKKFEKLIHRIFEPACLDITLIDRFGKPVRPREWFNVSLSAIDEAIRRIQDGSITSVIYDVKSGSFI